MNEELATLLRQYAGRPMTRAQIDAQRRSWVIGELMLHHLEMTRAEAEAIYDAATHSG